MWMTVIMTVGAASMPQSHKMVSWCEESVAGIGVRMGGGWNRCEDGWGLE